MIEEGAPRSERVLAAFAWIATAGFYFLSLGKPSLWLDEAWEANYYVGHTAAPWMNRPVLYMAGEKLMAAAAGPSEFALRVLPCMAALVAVAVLWVLVRSRIGRAEAWLSAAFLAFGPAFLFHAHQLKHYPFDALATTVLVVAYARWREERTTRRAIDYALVGTASTMVSFTALLVMAALAVVEVVSARGDRGALARFAGASAAVAAFFVPVFLLFHARDAGEGLLLDYWSSGFLPWQEPTKMPRWLASTTIAILKDHTGAVSGAAPLGLALAGLLSVPRRCRYLFGALGASLAVNVLASGLEIYPYGSARLSLYVAPLIAVAVGCGMASLVRQGPARPARALAAAVLAYATFHATWSGAVPYLSTGWRGENIRDMVAEIDRDRRPSEAIYVHEDAAPAFSFYWQRLGHEPPFSDVIWSPRLREAPERHAEGVAALAQKYERVWGLYSHAPPEEVRALRAAFRERYELVRERFVPPNAWLDLWQRRPMEEP